ncbi:MAG: hypothetical protein K9W44_05165 [Candidatus Lokiarchaeota archaeon]|nr:hypothetical protein [Candidatus Harpocratesius repetitus]
MILLGKLQPNELKTSYRYRMPKGGDVMEKVRLIKFYEQFLIILFPLFSCGLICYHMNLNIPYDSHGG